MVDTVDTETFRNDETKDERATMEAVMDRLEAEEKAERDRVKAEDVQPEPTETPAEPTTGAQPRDEVGRFAAKKAAEAAAKSADQPKAASPEPSQTAIEAPQSWSAAEKAKWATLPPDLKAYIAQREGEAHKQISTMGERLKEVDSLEPVIGPRRMALAAEYGSVAAAFQQLFAASDFATRDPAGFIRMIAERRGIDLRALIPQQAPQPQVPADPYVAATMRHQAELDRRLSAFEQQKQQAEIAQITDEIETFGRDKPYFAEVRATMAELIGNGFVGTLEDAYDRSIHGLPEIRERVWADRLAAEKAATEKAAAEAKAKAEADAKERAHAAARRGRVNVTSSGGGVSPSRERGNLREQLESAYDSIEAA